MEIKRPYQVGGANPKVEKGSSHSAVKNTFALVSSIVTTSLITEGCGPVNPKAELVFPDLSKKNLGLDKEGLTLLQETRDSFKSFSNTARVASLDPNTGNKERTTEQIISDNISTSTGIEVNESDVHIPYDKLVPFWINIGPNTVSFMPVLVEVPVEGEENQTLMFLFGKSGQNDWGQAGLLNSPLPKPNPDGTIDPGNVTVYVNLTQNPEPNIDGFWISSDENAGFSTVLEFQPNEKGEIVITQTLPDKGSSSIPLEDNPALVPTQSSDKPVSLKVDAMLAQATSVPLTPTAPAPEEKPSAPMIEVDGIKLPDPKVTNPELFDIKNPDSPIVEFANAFSLKAEDVNTKLTIQVETPDSMPPFVVMRTSDGIALIMATQENSNWVWSEATQGALGDSLGIYIGETTTSGYFQNWSKEKQAFREILRKFNLYVSDYDLMWYTPVDPKWGLRPSENEFNFKNFDQGQLLNNGKMFVGQTLLQSNDNYMPQWQKNINPNDPQNRERIKKIGINQIETVIKHSPGTKYWGVLSELEHPSRGNYWVTAMGGLNDLTWMKDFYDAAHDANPEAKLYYSDFDIEFGGEKADKVYHTIKTLKEMGAPINAIAFQLHLNGKDFTDPNTRAQKMEALREQIRRYNDIGIEVIAPEMDIAMMNVSNDQNTRFKLQADIEYDLIKVLLQENVKVISHFGGSDATNWRNQSKYGGGPDANATPFMEDGSPKPNYYAGVKALLDFISEK